MPVALVDGNWSVQYKNNLLSYLGCGELELSMTKFTRRQNLGMIDSESTKLLAFFE